MKYFGYFLGNQRFIYFISLITLFVGYAYYGSFKYLSEEAERISSGSNYLPRGDFGILLLIQVASLVFLLFVLSERGENLSNLGVSFQKKDFIDSLKIFFYGFGLIVLTAVIYAAVRHWFSKESFSLENQNLTKPYERAISNLPISILAPLVIINPLSEELIVRAFLMTELNYYLKKGPPVVFLSALTQTGYHLYQGWKNCGYHLITFLVFSAYYQKTKRATPLVLVHFYMDLIAISLLFFKHKT